MSPIKIYRERTGKTQEELAKALQVEPMTVSRWERGESLPRPKYLKTMERRFGIDPAKVVKHAMGAA